MLEPIVQFFDKLIENFSWRRLSFVLVLLFLTLVSLWAYEGYTSSFRLGRIERQVALLERLAKVGAEPQVRAETTLKDIYTELQAQVLLTARSSEVEYELLPWGKKVLAATAAWLVFALLLLLVPQPTGKGSVVLGVLLVAPPFIALAAALPTFEASWINYYIYPIGHLAAVVVAILWWQRRKQKRLLRTMVSPAPTSNAQRSGA
jgi:hypothetical protein